MENLSKNEKLAMLLIGGDCWGVTSEGVVWGTDSGGNQTNVDPSDGLDNWEQNAINGVAQDEAGSFADATDSNGNPVTFHLDDNSEQTADDYIEKNKDNKKSWLEYLKYF